MQRYEFNRRKKEISDLVSISNLERNKKIGTNEDLPEELEVVTIAHYDKKTNKMYFKQELIEDLI